jgi:hypothetical protein
VDFRDEDTKPDTPSVLSEIRQCIEESRALNARLENVLTALLLDVEFRREVRKRIGELDSRVTQLENARG